MPMIIPAIAPLPIPSLFQNKKEQRKKEKKHKISQAQTRNFMKFKKHKQNKQTNKNNINKKKKAVPPFLQHFHLPTEKSNGKHR